MKKSVKYLTVFLLSGVLLSSCKDEEKTLDSLEHSAEFNMISAMDNVVAVGSMDLLGIIEKTEFENNADMPSEAKMAWAAMVKPKLDKKESGIIFEGNNHVAVSGTNEKDMYGIVSFKVHDATKIKGALTEFDILKGKYDTKEIDGVSYETIADKEVTAMWDKDHLVVVFSADKKSEKIAEEMMKARFVDGADNDKLEAYLDRQDDMSLFYIADNLLKVVQNANADVEFNDEYYEAAKGAHYTAYLNFNNGEIIGKTEVDAPNLSGSEMDPFQDLSIDQSLFKFLTPNNLISFGVGAVDMQVVAEYLKLSPEYEKMKEETIKETGLSPEELASIFDGNFGYAFTGVKSHEMYSTSNSGDDFFEDNYGYKREVPVVNFVAGIKDTTLLKMIASKSKAKFINNFSKLDEDAYMVILKDKVVISTDSVTAGALALIGEFPEYKFSSEFYKGGPVFGYVNTNAEVYEETLQELADSEQTSMTVGFLNLFDNIYGNADLESVELVIKLKNKDQNALKTITDYVTKKVSEEPFF